MTSTGPWDRPAVVDEQYQHGRSGSVSDFWFAPESGLSISFFVSNLSATNSWSLYTSERSASGKQRKSVLQHIQSKLLFTEKLISQTQSAASQRSEVMSPEDEEPAPALRRGYLKLHPHSAIKSSVRSVCQGWLKKQKHQDFCEMHQIWHVSVCQKKPGLSLYHS